MRSVVTKLVCMMIITQVYATDEIQLFGGGSPITHNLSSSALIEDGSTPIHLCKCSSFSPCIKCCAASACDGEVPCWGNMPKKVVWTIGIAAGSFGAVTYFCLQKLSHYGPSVNNSLVNETLEDLLKIE